MKIIAENRKARHDYIILETYEAGIELKGAEVKSMRAGKANLKDSFANIRDGELFLYGMHVSAYEQGNTFEKQDPLRTRKLLMHKKEIMRLLGKLKEQGLTLVPLKLYFKQDKIKVELGLAKGKKLYDKRQTIAKNDQRRQAEKDFKIRNLTL